MTYLQLVNRLKQETGVAGSDITTTVGQVKELKRLCDWINAAYQDILLLRPDWEFMWKSVSFNTVDGQQTYHVGTGLDIDVSDFGYWRNNSFRSYLSSAGIGTEILLSQYHNFAEFRDFYLVGSRRLVTGRPLYYTVNPSDKAILLGFTPNDVYVVTGEYYQTPADLASDSAEPLFPARYHMAIVYKAMTKYGLYESAQEQITAGEQQYNAIINRMLADQLPEITTGLGLI